ncbi:MAG: TIGR02757 family protein [Bacteroidales bacterium]|nr:TIGR02757 family protein [Bacteroidales bacterium]
MEQSTAVLLQNLALKYETESFIPSDPVSFPHRWTDKKDIEISAFTAQWLAYGKRELFLKVLNSIGAQFGKSPYTYIINRGFENYRGDMSCLYRFYKKHDFYCLCDTLYNIYAVLGEKKKDMEEVLQTMLHKENITQAKTSDVINLLGKIFSDVNGIPSESKSACKRLCMFLRWMVRKQSAVDFGIWNIVKPQDLIVPLDVHVFRQSVQLGLTKRKDASMKTALEITENLKQVFPTDPVKADFALFGYGVNA